MIYRLFLGILIFSPLALGCSRVWSLTMMEGVAFSVLFCFLLPRLWPKGGKLYLAPGLLPFALFLLLILLQYLELPARLVQLISPAAFTLHQQASGILQPLGQLSLSVNRKATMLEFYRFAAYFAFYFLAVQLFTRPRYLLGACKVLVTFGALLALQALAQKATADNLIYWFIPVPAHATPVGPYVNRNHFAGLMEMISPLALALFFSAAAHLSSHRRWRGRLADLLANNEQTSLLGYGFAFIIMTVAICVSLSRGGVLSSGTALVLMVFMFKRCHRTLPTWFFTTIFTASAFVFVGWFGWDLLIVRFLKAHSSELGLQDGRLPLWTDTLPMIKDYLTVGSGAGTYDNLYPTYRTLPTELIYDHAHNDFLELLATLGLPGFLLLAWFLAAILRPAYKLFRQRQELFAKSLFVGSLGGIVALLLHSTVDFNFYIGANGLYFFLLCALLVSSVHTRMASDGKTTLLPAINAPRRVLVASLVLLAVLLGQLRFQGGVLLADRDYAKVKIVDLKKSSAPERAALTRTVATAISRDPLAAQLRFTAGNIATFEPERKNALARYQEAVQLEPTNGEFVQFLGLMADGKDPQAADKLLATGIRLQANVPAMHKRYAAYLRFKGKMGEAQEVLRKTILAEPASLPEYLPFMANLQLSDDQIIATMPANTAIMLQLTRYFNNRKNTAASAKTYTKAAAVIGEDPTALPPHYTEIAGYFFKEKNWELALEVAAQGTRRFPDQAAFKLLAGKAYQQKGDFQAAAASYRQAAEFKEQALPATMLLATLYAENGRAAEAEASADQAFRLLAAGPTPKTPEGYHALYSYYMKQKQFAPAQTVMSKAAALYPKDPTTQIFCGQAAEEAGDIAVAAESFGRARLLLLESAPKDAWPIKRVVSYYLRQNSNNNALLLLQHGRKSFPKDPEFFILEGDLYQRLQMPQEATTAYKKALEIAPNHEETKKKLQKLSAKK